MCGIAVWLSALGRTDRLADSAVDRMSLCMRSRGPDAEGRWRDEGVHLAHRRLAILDLDERANQPMLSPCDRYVITYNGEIYNFRRLRDELEAQGIEFRTTSDTEVILALFALEGAAMLSRLRGMFAFVIWDRVAKQAFAARDPYGIKPLYYVQAPDGVLLASQVRALLASGRVSRAPDLRGQAGFWLLGSVPDPHTWYRDIRALPAGHCAWIRNGILEEPSSWWDIGATWRDAPRTRMPAAEVRAGVCEALRASVSAHLVADVPVGVFLSGGIDSGALVGLMREVGVDGRIRGVTLAFREFAGRSDDEAPAASKLAEYYGIEHHIRTVTRDEFNEDLPRILDAMDQPTIDGVNTWYASKAAAELGLKVVVSGVGGDELFQGYGSFTQLPRLVAAWRPLSRVPGAMGLARGLCQLQAHRSGNGRWGHVPDWSRSIEGAWWLRGGLFSPEDLPQLMGPQLAAPVLRDSDLEEWVREMSGLPAHDHRLALGQILSTTYLRNQLLRDSDWASMDHSVELRTPLVDAWLLRDVAPLLSSFRQFPSKALLAQAPAKALPRFVSERQKTGFGVPVATWLSNSSAQGMVFDSRSVARRVAAHFS